MTRAPASVIYIAGYGRSGSTLLDLVLGNHPAIRGGGELMYLLDEFRQSERRCACQQPYATCDFWGPITRRFDASDDELRERLRRVDRRRGFLRKWFAVGRKRSSADFTAYRDFQRELFTLMARGGAKFVVDSSKSARDAAFRPVALHRIAGLDVRVIHLVRSPFRVVRSVLKHSNWQAEGYRRGSRLRVLKSLPGWILGNVAAWVTRYAVGRRNYLRINFSSLVEHPDEAIERIGRFLELDVVRLAKTARQGDAFRSGHQAGGNRLRMKAEVVIHNERAEAAADDEPLGFKPRP